MPDSRQPLYPSLSDAPVKDSLGRGLSDHGAGQIDMIALRGHRLARLQAELRRLDVAGILLADPVNIRYASGVRNMQNWAFHSTFRQAFVPAKGKVVAFEYKGSEHLAAGLETVAEVRSATPLFRAGQSGDLADPRVTAWAQEVAALTRAAGGDRLALDRHVDHFSALALAAQGLSLVPGAKALSLAQSVKNREEVLCLSAAITVAETALHRLRQAIEPGRSEVELWAILEATNVAFGGESMDTRLLSSGGRTNPWYQEASERLLRPSDIVAVDTDMIGPFGYDADISRSFFCGPGRPSAVQQDLYRYAWEQLHHNMSLLRPGISFHELSEASYLLPERYREQEMAMVWHGVGLYGQWPTVVAKRFFDPAINDQGIVLPGMTLCCESYVGAAGGAEGVKLEQMLLITESGVELLNSFPFEDDLLGRQL
ncbi:MAG: Xaa-Pro peptidase family protein [Rhodospirillales bacterium]